MGFCHGGTVLGQPGSDHEGVEFLLVGLRSCLEILFPPGHSVSEFGWFFSPRKPWSLAQMLLGVACWVPGESCSVL